MRLLTALAVLAVSGAALAGNNARKAEAFGPMRYEFNALPKKGYMAASTRAWSGPYWPFKFGGINQRWNAPGKPGFKYVKPTRNQVLKMSYKELTQLSPSEKWDIYNNDYSHYTVWTDAWTYNSPDAALWAGICHGWAPASLNHKEPTPKLLVNKAGVKIPFGSGDIKALLSYAYADVDESSAQLGKKCQMGRPHPNCYGDTNPAALHVLMANYLGLQGRGFLMDKDPYKEIWNQPVTGFKVISQSTPWKDGKGFKVKVKSELYWTDEADATWYPLFASKANKTQTMLLSYTLELDKNMRITDGDWEDDTAYPDFVWTAPKITKFKDMFEGLERLLNDK